MTAPYIRAETCCSKTLQYEKCRVSSLQQDVQFKSVLILFCITAVTIRIPLVKKLNIICSKNVPTLYNGVSDMDRGVLGC
jgi:hypothetical protein